ncbi:Eukaryotic translation initiation factor 3 subunit E [Chytriomyces hyalinus]|nr:Eukaryotic translation initiation factor 3 subunit E [Chytriomyces hyalinus]
MDLTNKIATLLDRHMVLPLLDFLSKKEVYPEKDLLKAKFELLKTTNMIDFANSIHQQLNSTDENSPEFEAKRPQVLATYEKLQTASAKVITILQDPSVLSVLKQEKNVLRSFLEKKFKFTNAMVDTLFDFAQCEFQIGSYQGAADMLFHFRILSTDVEKNTNALWGKLACEILLQKWDIALEELLKLKEIIDNPPSSSSSSPSAVPNNTQQLIQRSYFIAWSLFVFFNHPKGRDALIETFMQPAYISAIQTTCPWALRYLTACIVITKNRRKNALLKEIVRLVASDRELNNNSIHNNGQTQQQQQQDPLTGFIHTLYTEYNFSEAHKSLAQCVPVLEKDFFLETMKDEFCETARTMVFESYVKVYREIDIGVLSATLGLSRDEGEKWVVDLVRGVRMDAKIDSENNTVIMGAQYTSVFQNVIERTRNLTFRTNLLASNIEKREVELASRRAGATGSDGKKESKKGRRLPV